MGLTTADGGGRFLGWALGWTHRLWPLSTIVAMPRKERARWGQRHQAWRATTEEVGRGAMVTTALPMMLTEEELVMNNSERGLRHLGEDEVAGGGGKDVLVGCHVDWEGTSLEVGSRLGRREREWG